MDAGVETRVDLDELASRSAAFETAPAGKVMGWAVERFGGSLSLACSFQDCVIIDLAVEVDPGDRGRSSWTRASTSPRPWPTSRRCGPATT